MKAAGDAVAAESSATVAILARETLHHGRVFDVTRELVRLPSGLEQRLDIVRHPEAVCIAAVLDSGALVIVRQYRHATGRWLEEVPAGRVEDGESPLEAAKRELEEETGYRAERWRVATRFYPAPGFCSELHTLLVAEGLERIPGGGRDPDPDEEIDVLARTPRELLESSCDAKTLIAAAFVAR